MQLNKTLNFAVTVSEKQDSCKNRDVSVNLKASLQHPAKFKMGSVVKKEVVKWSEKILAP